MHVGPQPFITSFQLKIYTFPEPWHTKKSLKLFKLPKNPTQCTRRTLLARLKDFRLFSATTHCTYMVVAELIRRVSVFFRIIFKHVCIRRGSVIQSLFSFHVSKAFSFVIDCRVVRNISLIEQNHSTEWMRSKSLSFYSFVEFALGNNKYLYKFENVYRAIEKYDWSLCVSVACRQKEMKSGESRMGGTVWKYSKLYICLCVHICGIYPSQRLVIIHRLNYYLFFMIECLKNVKKTSPV